MPISIYLAPGLPELSELLASKQSEGDLFLSSRVLTPNRNLSRYIELYLAREKGICANLDFSYLDSFITNYCMEKLYGADTELELLGETEELLLLYSLLGNSENQILQSYGTSRQSEGTQNKETLSSYRLELASRLHGLFGGYERHQPAMVEAWIDGKDPKAAGPARKASPEIYEAEKKLYLAFHNACLDQNKPRLFELWHRLLQRSQAKKKTPAPESKESLHLFGFSQLSQLHLRLISALSHSYNIFYYITHPPNLSCESKAEPENSTGLLFFGKKPKWTKPEPNSIPLSFFEPAHRMLALFQKLHPDANWYAKPAKKHKQSQAGTLLFALKESFKENSNLYKQKGKEKLNKKLNIKKDASIQLAAAPGKRREMEAIYHSILRHLDRESELSLNEIAILLPDVASYRSAISSVFDANPDEPSHCLPYNLTDFDSEEESLYLSAQKTLFAILLGEEPDPADLLSLFQNPLFLAAWGAKPKHADFWVHWKERLSIYGVEQSLHPLRSWNAAGERLLLGLITEPAPFEKEGGLVLDSAAFPVQGSDAEEALSILLSILENWQKTKRELQQGFAASKEKQGAFAQKQESNNIFSILGIFLKKNIRIPDTPPEAEAHRFHSEQKIEDACFSAIEKLQKSQTAQSLIAADALPLRSLFGLLRKDLKNIQGSRGRYLSTGITISALQPMRPIPFRYIYIAGLNASDFPGREDTSSLNLLPKPASENNNLSSYLSLPERNNLLFMEMALAARDGLYLSYEAHDLQKDEAKLPSPALSALRDYINSLAEASLATKGSPASQKSEGKALLEETRPPLFLFDANYESDAAKEANSDFLYNYRLPSKAHLLQELPAAWQAVQSGLDQTPPADSNRAESEILELHKLTYFLNHPADAILRHRYGLYDPQKDKAKTEPVIQVYDRNDIFKKICSELIFEAARKAEEDGKCKLSAFTEKLSAILGEAGEQTEPENKKTPKTQGASPGQKIARGIYENFTKKGEAQSHTLGSLDFASIWELAKSYLTKLKEGLSDSVASRKGNSNAMDEAFFYPALALKRSEHESLPEAGKSEDAFAIEDLLQENSRTELLAAPELERKDASGKPRHIALQGEFSWIVASPNCLQNHIFVSSRIKSTEKLSALLCLFALLLNPPEPLSSVLSKESETKEINIEMFFYEKGAKGPLALSISISPKEARDYLERLLWVYLENTEGVGKPPEWLYPDLLKNAFKNGLIQSSEKQTNHTNSPGGKDSKNSKNSAAKAFREGLQNAYTAEEKPLSRMELTEQLFEPHFSEKSLDIYEKLFTIKKDNEKINLMEKI